MICFGLWIAIVAFLFRINVCETLPTWVTILCFVLGVVFYAIAYSSECNLRERVKKLEEKTDYEDDRFD